MSNAESNGQHPQGQPGGSSPSDPHLVARTIERLSAEQKASTSTQAQAVLLHEIAVLEQGVGDDGAAARDLLASINLEPEFREPLEVLVALVTRHQSFKNLTKLLERLLKVSTSPEEIERTVLDLAHHVALSEDDPKRALETVEEGLKSCPDSASLWLAVEILAGKLDEPSLGLRALSERAKRARHSTYRALLYVDLAKLQAENGDADGALASLQLAVDESGPATYIASQAMERLAREVDRPDDLARCLETRATLLEQTLKDVTLAESLGVPFWERQPPQLAQAWLAASEAKRGHEELVVVTKSLDKALSLMPDEPELIHARLNLAERAGDTQTAATLARGALERGASGPRAAALWLRVAEAAAADGDGAAALDAVNKALREDPGSVPARALELDLLSSGSDPAGLAQALERAADQLATDEGKARYYLAAADAWARLAHDCQGARAALSQAAMLGADPGLVARLGRMLAAVEGDKAWYEEATKRLIAAGSLAEEHPDLWFELARSRLVSGDLAGSVRALKELEKLPAGSFLGAALAAFSVPFAGSGVHTGGDGDGAGEDEDAATTHATEHDRLMSMAAEALGRLVDLESDPETARALRWLLVTRAKQAGDEPRALELLQALHEANPADVTASTTLAHALRQAGRAAEAAEALQASGTYANDDEGGAALLIQAGLSFWQLDDRKRAVECFNAAHELNAAAGGPLLRWALRAVEPNDLASRRRALDSAIAEGPVELLERFGLEIGRGGDVDAARVALENLPSSAPPDIKGAALLAKSLWSRDKDIAAQLDAVATLSGSLGTASAVTHAAEHLLELERARSENAYDATKAEVTASGWASHDPSAVAALEWLGTTVGTRDFAREVEARRCLAQRLDPVLGAAIEASANMIHMLSGGGDQAPLASVDPAALLTNLELAHPGCDPRKRINALTGAASLLGDEGDSLGRALVGYNQLCAGDTEAATASFRAVVEVFPSDVIGWEGLRAAALASGDRAQLAEACAALGDATTSNQDGSRLWEEAALILIDDLDDAERGEFALARAVARDVGRSVAFDKLFRIVRARGDGARLLDLIARRLEVAEDAEELAKLYWERARVLRKVGDHQGALSALENVTMLEPDHVGALALTGEIHLTTKQFPEAAESLGRLASMEDAPAKQRLMSGMAAVDIFEKKLNDSAGALTVLSGLYHAGLSTLPVRERLARAAATCEDWDTATRVLGELMAERDSSSGRAEAARLKLVIHRDRQEQPKAALGAVKALLRELPADAEALDLIFDGIASDSEAEPLLIRAKESLVAQLALEPLAADAIDLLSKVAQKLGDAPLRQAAIGALIAVGEGSQELDRELSSLDQRVATTPQTSIDEQSLPDLLDAEDRGPVGELMELMAPVLAEAVGPVVETFGVGKKNKVSARAGLPIRNEIVAWAGALGVGDFDLYVGGPDSEGIAAIATECPALVIGDNVHAPLSARHRQAVARELFALKRGTTILRHRDPTDIAALVVACGRLLEVDIPSPNYAMLADFERLLKKALPRRLRKPLTACLMAIKESEQSPVTWCQAATSSLDRMATLAAGDVSWVLASTGAARGQLGASVEAQRRAQRLLAFVLSPAYLELRERLGMGVR